MCGLVGFITKTDKQTSEGIIEKMTMGLRHRGPDAQTFRTWPLSQNKTLAFGHTLLRIFGRENEGIQPFIIEDAALVFNGAIYNFAELKEELAKAGVQFKTSTDTEVLAWGLKLQGLEFLKKARGMYAFAFFDLSKQEMWLARDPLGVKPLYIMRDNGILAFASEYKVLLPHMKNVEVDEQSVNDYLRLRYVPGNQTFIKQIRKASPGCVQIINLQTNETVEESFFDLDKMPAPKDEVLKLLIQAIERRSTASVPVAALLSGGIDSALVCDVLARKIPHLQSYTLKVGDGAHDESIRARMIADRIGIENQVLIPTEDNLEVIRRLSRHLDDPYGDPIILALDQIFRTIGRSQRVIVTGEGADELFSGYVHHRAVGLLDRVPSFLFGFGQVLLGLVPVSIVRRLLPYAGKISTADLTTALKRLRSVDLFDLTTIQRIFFLFDEGDIKGRSTSMVSKKSSHRVGLKEIRQWDFKNWLPSSQLFKLDKIAMASSIEAREPFVDQDLVGAIQKIPVTEHIEIRNDKPFFRNLMKGKTRIGDDVVASRKTSFFQPFDQKHLGALPAQIEVLVKENMALLETYVQSSSLKALLKDQDGGLLRQKKLFALGMLVLWFQEILSLKKRGALLE